MVPCPWKVLKVLAYLCTRETFKTGEFLFQQGDDDGCAFYIISGTAGLILETESGPRDIRKYSDGALLGTLSLLGRAHRLFSLQAKDELYVMVLERKKFIKGIAPFPETIPKIFQSLAKSIIAWEEQFIGAHGQGGSPCLDKIGVSIL